MRLAARSALALAVVLVLATCSSPTDPPDPPGDDPSPRPWDGPFPPMSELELTLSDSLQVHGYTWLRATPRAASGAVVPPPSTIVYSSSDETVATISSEGVIFGRDRGSVTITASSGSVQASLTLKVRARVSVTLAGGLALSSYMVAVGDTLPLAATFADMNGVPIDGRPRPGKSPGHPITLTS